MHAVMYTKSSALYTNFTSAYPPIMDTHLAMLILMLVSIAAGCLGALTGLGGGVVIMPVLIIGFGVDVRYAIGASLVAVIATSSGSAAAYVRDGFTNVRLGILLEVATVAGAIVGALIAAYVNTDAIIVLFVCALFYSAYATLRPPASRPIDLIPDPLATRLKLNSSYPTSKGDTPYSVHNVPGGLLLMGGAGVLSAMVGIGSGIVKVFAMDRLMRLPFKVSTTTSNFMIGVTAAASSVVYLHRGQIEPQIAGPVAFGALIGALVGARILPRVNTYWLRRIFACVVVVSGIELVRRTFT